MTSRLNDLQVRTLMSPINGNRVQTKDGMAHLAQQDVRAHLTRIFGYGGWDMEITDQALVAEWTQPNSRDATVTMYVACYRSTVRLTVKAADGTPLAVYEDSNMDESAPQRSRGAAHSLALTSSVSLALKRAASCLGDQFGLSLYNKGSRNAFVLWSIPHEYRTDPQTKALVSTRPGEPGTPSGDAGPPDLTQDSPKVEPEHDPDLAQVIEDGSPRSEASSTMGAADNPSAAPKARKRAAKKAAAPPPEPDNAAVDALVAELTRVQALADTGERLKGSVTVLQDVLRQHLADEVIEFGGERMTLRAAVDVAKAGPA